MESYLVRMFNHGAVMANIFSWGIGGEANRDHFFRKATEGPEALAAYAKFLKGMLLVEKASVPLPDKVHQIQRELPGWIQRTGRKADAETLVKRLDTAIKASNFTEAARVADLILKMISD